MKFKHFAIFSGIFIGLIIILTIVLACVKTTTSLSMQNPSSILIYNRSVGAVTYDEKNFKLKYENLLKEIKNIGKLSILDRASKKIEVNEKISQDISKKYSAWAEDKNLKNNICVELKFDKIQSQIVYFEGNTKKIDYKQLIFIVPEDGKTQEIAIYFMISDGANYSQSPMLMHANCSSLIKYIKSL